MRQFAVLIIFACTLPAVARADEPAAWTRAREHFAAGVEQRQAGKDGSESFRLAAADFLKTVRDNPRHAEACLNLGKSHYLAGDLPEAIAAFHAGLAVDPFDSRLHEGLAIARRSLGSGLAETDDGLRWFCSRWLDVAAALTTVAASLTLPFGLRAKRRRWTIVGILALNVAVLTGIGLTIRSNRLDDLASHPVVILRDDTPLRLGNGAGFESHSELPNLPRGSEVRQIGKRGDWLHVATPAGPIGWIPASRGISWRQACWLVEPPPTTQ